MSESESKFAEQLLGLGFRKLNPLTPNARFVTALTVEAATSTPVSPEARNAATQLKPPCFAQIGGIISLTIAYDENDERWIADALVDLKPLGFSDFHDALNTLRST